MNMRLWRWLITVPLIVACSGCILFDQLVTLTLNPDGSGELLIFRSNIRSTEEGARGEAELADYRAAFDGQTQDEFKHLQAAGARLQAARWLRDQPPMASILQADIPSAAVLEKLATVRDDDGNLAVQAKFSTSDAHRRLSFVVTVKPDQIADSPVQRDETVSGLKSARASGISDVRIALAAGRITGARGFTIAEDRQSAVLDGAEVEALLRAGEGHVELYLDWEVPR